MQSEDFRVRWASHDVRQYRSGTQPFHHSLVGNLTLNYEAPQVTTDVDLILIVYTAEPDSPSQAALSRLANWAVADKASANQPGEQPGGVMAKVYAGHLFGMPASSARVEATRCTARSRFWPAVPSTIR
jgi:hypothetical protein